MKRTIAAILSAAMLVTAAAAAEAPSSWAKSAVDTARNAGIVPEQVDQAYTQSITRADFCALAAAVYRTGEERKRKIRRENRGLLLGYQG